MSKKTIGLVVGLLILTVFLVALAMQSSQQVTTPKQETPVAPSPEIEAKTRLFMSPDPVNLTNNRATITVKMDSQDNKVTGVQMEVSYDPKVLSFVSITPVSTFAQGVPLLNTVDRKNGRISYAVGLSPQQAKTALTGEADVATLVFSKVTSATTSAASQTMVEFLPKSLVSATGVDKSVLKETVGTTILLNN